MPNLVQMLSERGQCINVTATTIAETKCAGHSPVGTAQRIPRIVWQTSQFSNASLPSDIATIRQTHIASNPEYRFHLISDATADAFIRASFSPYVYAAYQSLQWGVAKADFWRYCVLLERGGIYLDIDSRLRRPLRTLIRPGDSAVLADEWHHRERPKWRWGAGPWCKCNTEPCRAQLMKLRCNTSHVLQIPGQRDFENCRSGLPRLHTQIAQLMLVAERGHPLFVEMVHETARAIHAWRDTPESLSLPLVNRVLVLTGPCALALVFQRWVGSGTACYREADGTLICQVRGDSTKHPTSAKGGCFRLLPERTGRDYEPYAERHPYHWNSQYDRSNASSWERLDHQTDALKRKDVTV